MSMPNTSTDPPLLRIEGLGVRLPTRHGEVRAVDGVSLALPRGRTLGLVGESGCGKSMLCRAVMGLLPDGATLGPEAKIVFDGQELAGRPESAYRRIRGRQIAMVFQDCLSSLNPVMTIGRQIAETLMVHLHMDSRTACGKAMALLDQVDVPDPKQRMDYYPHQLSGGIVEKAPADRFFGGMRMPYSRALTDCMPRLDVPPHTPLRSIRGQPPDLIRPIQGCAFSPRCEVAQTPCFSKPPPLSPAADNPDHWFACWYPLTRGAA